MTIVQQSCNVTFVLQHLSVAVDAKRDKHVKGNRDSLYILQLLYNGGKDWTKIHMFNRQLKDNIPNFVFYS